MSDDFNLDQEFDINMDDDDFSLDMEDNDSLDESSIQDLPDEVEEDEEELNQDFVYDLSEDESSKGDDISDILGAIEEYDDYDGESDNNEDVPDYEEHEEYDEVDDEEDDDNDFSGDDLANILEDNFDDYDEINEFLDDDDEEDDYFGSLNFSSSDTEKVTIDDILGKSFEMGASDVHISPDAEVAFTILGEIVFIKEYGIIPANIVQRAYAQITSHESQAIFAENLELDTAYTVKSGKYKGRRLRLSVGRSFSRVFMVFRTISDSIPSPEELGVPDELKKWINLPNGLVLICGPTGTGKSTTFASLINQINLNQSKKIITVERPIEYIYPTENAKSLVTQREIGRDARSFSNALTSAMRQAPNVIMIGEVRDKEEVDSLLRASETGHLALSTMHTTSPAGTINRIKSLYEGDEQLRVLSSLKDNVRGIANQVLLRSKDGRSRFAVHCVLDVTPEVSDMIGAGDVGMIQQYMEDNKMTIEHKLVQAVLDKKCDIETARNACIFPDKFDAILKSSQPSRPVPRLR